MSEINNFVGRISKPVVLENNNYSLKHIEYVTHESLFHRRGIYCFVLLLDCFVLAMNAL